MRFYLLLIFIVITSGIHSQANYHVIVKTDRTLIVKASFQVSSDTIFIYQRGTTSQLPQGEAEFIKSMVIRNHNGKITNYIYAGDGNYKIDNATPGEKIEIEYQVRTDHKNYNWDHVGGVDEAAFETKDGFFFTGYCLFIVPDLDLKEITVQFDLPDDWKASTPWQKTAPDKFQVENARFLLNNCLMIGKHQEKIIRSSGMEMRLAISNKLAYSLPLVDNLMQKLIPAYQQMFGDIPAPAYLVVMNEENMTDGSAFRRSFSQIFKEDITSKGIPAWGYIMGHEILHLWNGHSLIPSGQEEWFKEGFTDYLTMIAMSKTGLLDREIVYRKLENIARRYWLDRYWQRDTLSVRNTGNHKEQLRFGVYGGGAIVAIALEIEMRKATGYKKGIPHLMHRMFNDFAKQKKTYSLGDITRIVNKETDSDLSWFFDKYVTGREFLELGPYMKELGLDYYPMIEEVYISKNKNASVKQTALFTSIFKGTMR